VIWGLTALLEADSFRDIEKSRTMQVMNNKHTPLAKGAKLQNFNHHHQTLQQRDKDNNVQAHSLGTYPR
jgi:hypothetical protein